MAKSIVITYKNGSIINIDIPETYYIDTYKNTSQTKLHKVFMKEYEHFVSALNKSQSVINVGKYLKFSTATISCQDILGVDIRVIENDTILSNHMKVAQPELVKQERNSVSSLDIVFKKLEETNLIENLDIVIKELNKLLSNYNIDIVAKSKSKSTVKKASTTKTKETKVDDIQE